MNATTGEVDKFRTSDSCSDVDEAAAELQALKSDLAKAYEAKAEAKAGMDRSAQALKIRLQTASIESKLVDIKVKIANARSPADVATDLVANEVRKRDRAVMGAKAARAETSRLKGLIKRLNVSTEALLSKAAEELQAAAKADAQVSREATAAMKAQLGAGRVASKSHAELFGLHLALEDAEAAEGAVHERLEGIKAEQAETSKARQKAEAAVEAARAEEQALANETGAITRHIAKLEQATQHKAVELERGTDAERAAEAQARAAQEAKGLAEHKAQSIQRRLTFEMDAKAALEKQKQTGEEHLREAGLAMERLRARKEAILSRLQHLSNSTKRLHGSEQMLLRERERLAPNVSAINAQLDLLRGQILDAATRMKRAEAQAEADRAKLDSARQNKREALQSIAALRAAREAHTHNLQVIANNANCNCSEDEAACSTCGPHTKLPAPSQPQIPSSIMDATSLPTDEATAAAAQALTEETTNTATLAMHKADLAVQAGASAISPSQAMVSDWVTGTDSSFPADEDPLVAAERVIAEQSKKLEAVKASVVHHETVVAGGDDAHAAAMKQADDMPVVLGGQDVTAPRPRFASRAVDAGDAASNAADAQPQPDAQQAAEIEAASESPAEAHAGGIGIAGASSQARFRSRRGGQRLRASNRRHSTQESLSHGMTLANTTKDKPAWTPLCRKRIDIQTELRAKRAELSSVNAAVTALRRVSTSPEQLAKAKALQERMREKLESAAEQLSAEFLRTKKAQSRLPPLQDANSKLEPSISTIRNGVNDLLAQASRAQLENDEAMAKAAQAAREAERARERKQQATGMRNKEEAAYHSAIEERQSKRLAAQQALARAQAQAEADGKAYQDVAAQQKRDEGAVFSAEAQEQAIKVKAAQDDMELAAARRKEQAKEELLARIQDRVQGAAEKEAAAARQADADLAASQAAASEASEATSQLAATKAGVHKASEHLSRTNSLVVASEASHMLQRQDLRSLEEQLTVHEGAAKALQTHVDMIREEQSAEAHSVETGDEAIAQMQAEVGSAKQRQEAAEHVARITHESIEEEQGANEKAEASLDVAAGRRNMAPPGVMQRLEQAQHRRAELEHLVGGARGNGAETLAQEPVRRLQLEEVTTASDTAQDDARTASDEEEDDGKEQSDDTAGQKVEMQALSDNARIEALEKDAIVTPESLAGRTGDAETDALLGEPGPEEDAVAENGDAALDSPSPPSGSADQTPAGATAAAEQEGDNPSGPGVGSDGADGDESQASNTEEEALEEAAEA